MTAVRTYHLLIYM